MQDSLVVDFIESSPLMADLDTPIRMVIKQIADSDSDALIVLSRNSPIGMVTEDDVIHININDEGTLNRPIKDIMSSPAIKLNYKANFSGADLSNADFSGSNLILASFQKATLYQVNFKEANLSGANFEGALWINGKICQENSYGKCNLLETK